MYHKCKAVTILKSNSCGNFTTPYKNMKSIQWNWDSAFSALGIFTYDKDRGVAELDSLLEGQWENGLIPQAIYREGNDETYPLPELWEADKISKTSYLPHPPVLSSVLWLMITMGLRDKDTLNRLFDAFFRYQKWFIENRDPYKKGLISSFHPWETARENSPDWGDALNDIHLEKTDIIRKIPFKNYNTQIDNVRHLFIIEKMRELEWDSKSIHDKGLFNICDPSVQFIFIRSCKDLYKIATYLEKTEMYSILEEWIDLYSFGSNYLWNMKLNAYSTLNIHTGLLFNGISCGSMLYAYADIGNKEQRDFMYSHSKRILYYTKYGFPSWDPNHIDFHSKNRWKGPIWCIINFLLTLGFKQNGLTTLSDKLNIHTKLLIENNDFFEYFNPYSGFGYGNTHHSGTAAMYLLFTNKLLD